MKRLWEVLCVLTRMLMVFILGPIEWGLALVVEIWKRWPKKGKQ